MFDLIFIKSINQIIWGGNYFIDFLRPTNCFIVWDKTGPVSNRAMPFSDCELAWTSFNSVARKYSCRNTGFIRDDRYTKKQHPTQKPTQIFTSVLNDYSTTSDTVVDPFLGSGTTAVACERLKRRWIGIEIEEKYCEIAVNRIERERKQLRLF